MGVSLRSAIGIHIAATGKESVLTFSEKDTVVGALRQKGAFESARA